MRGLILSFVGLLLVCSIEAKRTYHRKGSPSRYYANRRPRSKSKSSGEHSYKNYPLPDTISDVQSLQRNLMSMVDRVAHIETVQVQENAKTKTRLRNLKNKMSKIVKAQKSQKHQIFDMVEEFNTLIDHQSAGKTGYLKDIDLNAAPVQGDIEYQTDQEADALTSMIQNSIVPNIRVSRSVDRIARSKILTITKNKIYFQNHIFLTPRRPATQQHTLVITGGLSNFLVPCGGAKINFHATEAGKYLVSANQPSGHTLELSSDGSKMLENYANPSLQYGTDNLEGVSIEIFGNGDLVDGGRCVVNFNIMRF